MLLLSLLLQISFADFGILKLKGTVVNCNTKAYGDISKPKVVNASDIIPAGTCLKSEDGYIVLKKGSNLIVAKGDFSINVSDAKPMLNRGKARFQLQNVKEFKLTTRNAVAGVRGTDFFVSVNPDLGETEVICIESKITLSHLDGSGEKIIPAGYWGGKGGRFGEEIKDPMFLDISFVQKIKKDMAL
jgi:hypothetical protein